MVTRPNFILLILDALRARSVSAYGLTANTTPALDNFAGENLLFRHAFSNATWTIPSHASMLSGLYLSQHRVESVRVARRFNPAILTLPAALRTAGYRSAGFSQNILFSGKHSLDQGFDEFYVREDRPDASALARLLQRFADGRSGLPRTLSRYLRKMTGLRLFLDDLLSWIRAANQGAPFFLMANVANAHSPWAPPPARLLSRLGGQMLRLRRSEYTSPRPFLYNSGKQPVTEDLRSTWTALYLAAVSHVDQEVGRFLKRLQQLPGWGNTTVVITADHGEMLGEYRDIVGHTLCLHDNVLRVPLIVRHPDYTTPRQVETIVQTLDVFSTLLEWGGAAQAPVHDAQRQRPALSMALADPDSQAAMAFAEEDYTDSYDVIGGLLKVNPRMPADQYPRRQVAVRTRQYKYLWFDDRPAALYDLTRDPDETSSLLEKPGNQSHPARAALHAALQEWQVSHARLEPLEVRESREDPVLAERLRDLGYLA
jgi:arylsulfatase A-like enzyme